MLVDHIRAYLDDLVPTVVEGLQDYYPTLRDLDYQAALITLTLVGFFPSGDGEQDYAKLKDRMERLLNVVERVW